MRFLVLLLSLSALLISGCSEVELASHVVKTVGPGQSEGKFKVGNPYDIFGKTYYPREQYDLVETGIASWYGPQFHGNYTANGEIFDMNELTAAHRTLQMPSIARVTNLENGRSVIVRINDRGPFKRGRVLDLSSRAADLLDVKTKGTAKVRIEVLSKESRAVAAAARRGEDTKGYEVAMNEHRQVRDEGTLLPDPPGLNEREAALAREAQMMAANDGNDNYLPAADLLPPPHEGYSTPSGLTPVSASTDQQVAGHVNAGKFYPDPVVRQLPVTPTNIYVQAGSFTNKENAIAFANKLGRKAGVYPAEINGQSFYRVRIPSNDVSLADKLLDELASAGNKQAIIVVE